MASDLFPAQEIGSLAKPNWRVLGYRGVPIPEQDFIDAKYWGKKLRIEGYERLLELLKSDDSPEVRQSIREWSAIYAIRLLEAVGLDYVYDGEQWRTEMYEALVKDVPGFKFIGHVRSWDNKYYRKAAVIEELKWVKPIYLDEFKFTSAHATKKIKVPLTGPYTVMDWSFNEYYLKKLQGTAQEPRKLKESARQDLFFDVALKLIRPELQSLIDGGATWIQIDEPALSTEPGKEQVSMFVNAVNEMLAGLECKFSLHVCYSADYSALFPELLEAKKISHYAFEFANRDSNRVGDARRTGYEVVKLLGEMNAGREIGLGVIDVHEDWIEPSSLIKERILYAAGLIKDARLIYVNPDCGLRTRDWKVTFKKLTAMTKGADAARKSYE